jgi:hypothetical protein
MPSPILFLVWKSYQRRVDAFRERLNIRPIYIHFGWEERSALHKSLSYLHKLVSTFAILLRERPLLFIVQAPPIFPLYAAVLYRALSGAQYLVDAHNPMISGGLWCKLPFARYVLRQAALVIVHNERIALQVQDPRIRSAVLMDRPPGINEQDLQPTPFPVTEGRPRVVVPCSYDSDEPIAEVQHVTHLLPEVDFYFTWYPEKVPADLRRGLGRNAFLTGFLPPRVFSQLLLSADAILVLTTRDDVQPSGASEAVGFHKPLVISDSQIIRALFPLGCVYVQNQASAIARGVRLALERKEDLTAQMAAFRNDKLHQWEQQYQALLETLDLR